MAINPDAKLIKDLHNPERIPPRFGYGDGLVLAGDKDPNVVVMCCDLTESTRTHLFRNKYPTRFFEMGIAEQNMASVAAGMADVGKVPFINSYAVFSPGRNWDQVRVSICYSEQNVKIAGLHAGISVGPDGATHQALEDVAITRCLPKMTVVVPCDAIEAKKATLAGAARKGPFYFRFGREKTAVMTTEETPFEIGKAITFRHGKDVAIVGCGLLLYDALLAAEELEKEGIDAMVINMHTIKPLDNNALLDAVNKCGCVVTVEEHQIIGGLGGAVSEFLSMNRPTPVKMVGMIDSFGESGQPEELLAKHGMSKEAIKKAVYDVLKMKR